MNFKGKILVVEDELHIAEGLKLSLTLEGYHVKISSNGIEALNEVKNWEPDLIVLDLMMPKMDGMTFLKHIRRENERLPIIVLSAKFESQDKIQCFTLGIDDYIAKPFNLPEFLLRVERLLERSNWSKNIAVEGIGDNHKLNQIDVFKFGNNTIDFTKAEASNGNEKIHLTIQEMKLLKHFIINIDRPLTRKNILQTSWEQDGEATTRTVDNFIVRFRKYFEADPKRPLYFKSVRSVGYLFAKE